MKKDAFKRTEVLVRAPAEGQGDTLTDNDHDFAVYGRHARWPRAMADVSSDARAHTFGTVFLVVKAAREGGGFHPPKIASPVTC